MTLRTLLLRNLRYHRRADFALMLGTAVGAAVLTGALLVGDSLRASLRERSLGQIGWIENVLISPQFLTRQAAEGLPGRTSHGLILQGVVQLPSANTFLGSSVPATIYGIEPSFWPEGQAVAGVAVSAGLAERLQLSVGNSVQAAVTRQGSLPRASLLGKRDAADATKLLDPVSVEHILPDDHFGSRFQLTPAAGRPLSLFVPLAWLQNQSAVKSDLKRTDLINVVFAAGSDKATLENTLAAKLTLTDWGLQLDLKGPPQGRYYRLTSRRLLIDDATAAAAKKAAEASGWSVARNSVYLGESLCLPGTQPKRGVGLPYPILAGVDFGAPGTNFLPPRVPPPQPGEILLADLKDKRLPIEVGGMLDLTYMLPEIEGEIRVRTEPFRVAGFLPVEVPWLDRDLTPEFPGITDVPPSQMEPPFTERYHPEWNTIAEDRFYEQFRNAPKVLLRLEDAERLWRSRFGWLTSLHFVPRQPDSWPADAEAQKARLAKTLLDGLDPTRGGFVFDDVRGRLLAASVGGTDFGMLFVGFSFFLIGSALLLITLLARLNAEQRGREIGLLLACGYPPRTVQRLLLLESSLVVGVGSLVGLLPATQYAGFLLKLLTDHWPDPSSVSFLKLHISVTTLLIGYSVTVCFASVAAWWGMRSLNGIAINRLLSGATEAEGGIAGGSRVWRRAAMASAVAGIGLLVAAPYLPAGEAQAGGFFSAGGLLLTSAMLAFWDRLKNGLTTATRSLLGLGIRGVTRRPSRSLLTTGLLASASFLLVAVEAFRRSPERDFALPTGGSGGFALLGESTLPIYRDPDSPDGRAELFSHLELVFQQQIGKRTDGPTKEQLLNDAKTTLDKSIIIPCRRKGGDDASCLNLYQANRPHLLGVSDRLMERGGFRFAGSLADTPETKANPWLLLQRFKPEEPIPVAVEKNSAMWMLKKRLGDVLEAPEFVINDENGSPLRFRIVALLQDSPFQSELLMSDAAFRRAYPHEEGFRSFLISCPTEEERRVRELLTAAYATQGLTITPSRERVANYLQVQNTYLSTFQILGGFGLLLGVCGVAVIVLRNVWERRSESALLRGLGYRESALQVLTLGENGFLIVVGMLIGVTTALIGVLPHVETPSEILSLRVAGSLGGTLILGFVTAYLAVRSQARVPVLIALRSE